MRHRQAIDPERVLVVAPTFMDAALSQSILTEAGLTCQLCADPDKLGQIVSEGVGAILLTEELLAAGQAYGLAEALRRQPAWSDIPVLLLSAAGADSSPGAYAMELFDNVTVLERPVRITNLVSALQAALRARRRQYELRDRLAELERAETSLRKQSERLRLLWEAASVLLTTERPDAMMQALFAKIAPHFQLDCYFNFILTEAGDALRLQSCIGIPEEELPKISRLEFGQAVCGTAALRRQSIVATHIQQSDDPMVQLAKNYGIRAYACSPLIIEDRLLGTLSFASRQKDRFKSEELEFLQTICHYATVAYERVRLIDRLRDADNRKNEFLATLAHELRNPLAPIRNALQIMQLTNYGGAAAEQARGIMERQLRQMVRLIDDLLDVSRISRGKLELRKERVELAAVIHSAVDMANPLIEASGHRLTLSLPGHPVYLNADSLRLAQVFSNLLNNAAKYMDQGGHIELTATCPGKEAIVKVRDTGIGIPAEALSSIFEMFMQVDRSLEKSQGGLGIGLTLVKKLVEMHNGHIEARSEGLNRGAEFIVRLPLAPALGSLDPRSSRSS